MIIFLLTLALVGAGAAIALLATLRTPARGQARNTAPLVLALVVLVVLLVVSGVFVIRAVGGEIGGI